MRRTPLVLALAASLLIASTACTQQIKGSARADPVKAPVALVKDGFGIKLGFDDAPVQLELYTEPQCNHCADLQADFGDRMLSYINLGQLALTYRPVTFLDAGANQHSERVANAMFAAVSPHGGSGDAGATNAGEFQHFVEELWKVYDAGPDHPDNEEIAKMARTAGISAAQVSDIEAGKPAVDVKDLEDNNFEFLYEIDDISTGTPTVYDLKNDKKLDVYDDNWLSKVMGS
ncbi:MULTISPECIES: DsbA family protein [unclassified Mycobacterium]|uniref:DsbA family protein n=1 Tax=unclassified Mycobacterium TaxID=2642494 RepID=UPI0029C8CDEC|nr:MULTISPECIES: thioredoxin domain-containing protein [unclassified Mycobacterium]